MCASYLFFFSFSVESKTDKTRLIFFLPSGTGFWMLVVLVCPNKSQNSIILGALKYLELGFTALMIWDVSGLFWHNS